MTVTLRRSIIAGGVCHAAGSRWRVDRTFGHKVRISSCGRVLYVPAAAVAPARLVAAPRRVA